MTTSSVNSSIFASLGLDDIIPDFTDDPLSVQIAGAERDVNSLDILPPLRGGIPLDDGAVVTT